MDKFSAYHNAVDFLEGLSNLPREKYYMTDRADASIYLKRTQYLLNLLGNPEKKLKYIHITGTAGKGSVASKIHTVLVRAGFKAGLFTSPFSTTSLEKIQVGKDYISSNEFARLVEEIKPALNKTVADSPYDPPSYFEIFACLALLHFQKKHCRWAVMEVGCGGRYDATNVIPKPEAAILTNVGFDHTEILGRTLIKIAYEKIGIVKPHTQFWTAEQRPHLLNLFKSVCKKQRASFHWIKKTTGDFNELNDELVKNVCQNLQIPKKYIEQGTREAFMPCRFEIIQHRPVVILDGAHNEAKIKSTVESLKKIKYRKLYLIMGVAENKDLDTMIKLIVPQADYFCATRFVMKERKCANPKLLLKSALPYLKKSAKNEIQTDPDLALKKALKQSGKNDAILVTGSFFLAGHLRKFWYPEEWVLEHRRSK